MISEDEKYVCSYWSDFSAMTRGRFDICDPSGDMDWAAARTFTNARLKQIQYLQEEIAECKKITMQSGDVFWRVARRLQSTLTELRKGMKKFK